MMRAMLVALLVSTTPALSPVVAHAQDDWGVVGRCGDMESADPLIVPLPSRRPGLHASQWAGTIQYSATYECEDCHGGGKYSWSAQHVYTLAYGKVTASGSIKDRTIDIGVENSGITGEHLAKGDVAFSRVSMAFSPLWSPGENARPLRNVYTIQIVCGSSKGPLLEGTYSEKGVGGGDSFTEPRTKLFGSSPTSHELVVWAQAPANANTLTGTYRDTHEGLVRTWTVNLQKKP